MVGRPEPGPNEARSIAFRIIKGEHDSVAAVMKALARYVRPLLDHEVRPDRERIESVFSYIETFIDRFHHPKEDELIFSAMRGKSAHIDSLLLDLQHEHATGPRELEDLMRSLVRTRGGGGGEVTDFALKLDRYTKSQLEHIRKEDLVVFPLGWRAIRARQWEPIAAAFKANQDPFFNVGSTGPIGNLIPRLVSPA